MNLTMSIFRKELKSYFNSAVAYIVIVVFLLVTGWFFSTNIFIMNQASLRMEIGTVIPIVMFFFVPAITMRLLAEEKRSGTMELLATMPIKTHQIVVGKFLASFFLLGLSVLLTFPYLITISALGNPDVGAILAGYVGLLLLGATYLSIGIFASSVTKNQIVSFIVSFLIILVFFMLDKVTILFSGSIANIMQYISTGYHFENIARGVFDSRDLIYFISVIAFFLFLSNRSLESLKN